jgi:alanyl-tRNA synthetase
MTPESRLPTPESSDQIRAAFIKFWQDRGSHLQPSSSLIPYNDPSVLLTTAGMQQFVPFLLGKERPPHVRYVSVQKCFRTSDIDEVGDRSHNTFFEMLGNFSIGDYFKAEVIPWALEFSTQQLGLEQHRLWITIHETDDEANEIWLKAGIPQQRIKRFGDEENWWGPTGLSGPCGPNSELYYEQGRGFGCGFPGDPPDCDCGRLEFWNLVFMQFNQDEHGLRTPLPRKNVDTGMGIERATVVTLGLKSIYDTDLFQPLIRAGEVIAGVQYGLDWDVDYALRVLADHARAVTFLVLDGVIPGTGGREYVLRRIVRRAIRYGRRLGIQRAFLADLVDVVVQRMGSHYPDLERESRRIKDILSGEEELFARTLQAGSAQIQRLIAEARARGDQRISGDLVFDLYQTYGFPVELTEEILREEDLELDRDGYEAALEAERERARAASRFVRGQHTDLPPPGVTPSLYYAGTQSPSLALRTASVTGDLGVSLPPTEFLAWTATQTDTKILYLESTGERGRLILEASPFYPEGGGQVGDTGSIRTPGGVFVVDDTRFDGAGHIVHYGHVEGEIHVGDRARAEVDAYRRDRSRRHHTATHLLHRALKDVLGEGTSQQGSYVGPDQLRFDFNYARPLDREQLREISNIINDRSMDDLPVHWEIMSMQRARQLGAIMMFDEKYGDEVRVVSIGDYSRELCGGTHIHHSGELGSIVVASESGIGSGKRRIFAYAGRPALDYLTERIRLLETLSQRVGARSPDELESRVDSVLAEIDTLRKEVQRRQQQQANDAAGALAAHAREVGGVKVVSESVDRATRDDLTRLVDAVRTELRSGVVVLGSVEDGKVPFVVGVTRDLADRVHAGRLATEIGRAMAGGGGGNRPDFATGSGTQPAKLGAALQHAYTVVEQALQHS